MRRPHKNRCQSCRKLKIKCDENRPKCEYCNHTNRECIYGDSDSSPESDKSLSEPQVWRRQGGLNSLPYQIGISTFEYRLLKYFHEVYLPPGEMKQPPLKNLWQVQVPKLFHESALVRSSIFSLCSLNLWNLCDLSSWIHDSVSESEMKFIALGNLGDLDDMPNISEYLMERTRLYYEDTLQKTFKLINELSTGQLKITSINGAAEIVISGVLLFSFLALQTHGLLPLVSFDAEQPDLLSMCYGMRVSMMKAFPLLYDSQYSALFYKNEILTPPKVTENYPFVEYLAKEVEKYHDKALITTSQYENFLHAVNLMNVLTCSSIEQNFPLPLYKWVFLVKEEVYEYARRDKLFLAFKLMYAYACLNMICKFYLKQDTNMWRDYIDWYKDHSFTLFGSWNDDYDRRFYELVVSKYTIPDDHYDMLRTFYP